MAIMIIGEKKGFKGFYAMSSFYCGIFYAIVLFYLMENTLESAGLSLFLGAIFFTLISSAKESENKFFGMKGYYPRLIRFAMALFLFSATFLIYGKLFAAGSSFDTYSFNTKKICTIKGIR